MTSPSNRDELLPETLLATKTAIPPTRRNVVLRPRLAGELDAGLSRKLAIISAPAGYGKTTLLSVWANACKFPVAWISLDDENTDLARFLQYLITALRPHVDDVGASTLAMLQQQALLPIDQLATPLINDLASVSSDLVIVLDDYHFVDAQDVHDIVAFFLDHMPTRTHMVISARSDPPLPLAGLRGAGELIELRAANLRFTLEEATVFLAEPLGIELSEEAVAVLSDQVEGWAVGLQLAGLALKGRKDPQEFIDEFSGSHRYVVDYLSDEVMRRQSDDMRRFLLETSILDSLTPALCDAVTIRKDSHDMLSNLEQANLFLFPLDDRRKWYRYHHLFRDVLRFRLSEQTDDEGVEKLHHRAMQWYEDSGLETEALRHALLGKDFERAALLIEHIADTVLWHDTHWATLLNWIEALPNDLVTLRPRLNLYYGWALFTTGQWEAVESVLVEVEDAIHPTDQSTDSEDMHGEIETIRAWLFYQAGDLPGSVELARVALDHLSSENLSIRAIATFAVGMAAFWTGDMSEARPALNETIATSRKTGNLTAALMAYGCLTELEIVDGHLRRANEIYKQAFQLGRVKGDVLLGPTGLACIAMGEVLRERNDLEAAEQTASEGLQLCVQQGGMEEFILEGNYTLARIRLARGDIDGASEALQQAEQRLADLRLRGGSVHKIISQALAYRARLWLAQGQVSQAAGWVEGGGLMPDESRGTWHLIDSILQARVLLAQQKADKAAALLEGLLAPAEAVPRLSIEVLLLTSLAHNMLGEQDQALPTLSEALIRAEPEGFVRTFADEGPQLALLMTHLLTQSPSSEAGYPQVSAGYVRDLVTIINEEGQRQEAHPALAEQLTDRELSVLRLIAAGYTNQEIADELVIALGTVKQYNHIIFRKLEVRTREDAAMRAKELKLL